MCSLADHLLNAGSTAGSRVPHAKCTLILRRGLLLLGLAQQAKSMLSRNSAAGEMLLPKISYISLFRLMKMMARVARLLPKAKRLFITR